MDFLQFSYGGHKYRYMAVMFSPTERVAYADTLSDKSTPKFSLDYNGIKKIEYWNSMSDPLIHARIEYIDVHADVSIFIGMPYVYCHLTVDKVKVEDGETDIDEDCHFSQPFLVQSIDPLGMVGNYMKYAVNMVSVNWWSFAANVDYSNYDKSEPETATDILKAIFQQQGLKLNVPDSVNIKDQFYYVTTPRDTMFTAYKHLLGKAYRKYAEFDQNVFCPIVYNDIDGEYYWMSVKDPKTYQKQTSDSDKDSELVAVSMFSSLNSLIMQGKPYFASANVMDKTDVYKFIRRINHASYDFELGQFAFSDCDQRKRTEFLHSQINADSISKKFIPFDQTQPVSQKPAEMDQLSYYRTLSDWDDPLNNYSQGLGLFTKCDTVVINVVGMTSRRPGITIYMTFDTDEQQSLVDSETIYQYKKLQSKMVGLMGYWFVTSVHHVLDFSGQQPTFRDNLTLGRNFRMG